MIALGLLLALQAEPVKIALPLESPGLSPGPNIGLANARCLVCHSSDYLSMQPPMARAAWKASVAKMKQRFGADIPDSEMDLLAEYLAKAYGAEKSVPSPDSIRAFNMPVPVNAAPTDGAGLAQANGCVACHAVDRKIVGPAFKDIAAKYRGNNEGPAKVTAQILNGGGGNWGPVPMPSFAHLTQAEINTLATWVLATKP